MLLINLIYDFDLFCYLCGEVWEVQVLVGNVICGLFNEDNIVLFLCFVNGVLGSLIGCDVVVVFWSWELVVGENLVYLCQVE